MKTTAYICDCCNCVFVEDEVVALVVKAPELFSTAKTEFETTDKLDKSTIHFALSCYRKQVTDLLKPIDRTKDEAEYTYLYKLYSTKFYEKIYTATLLRNNAGNRRKKKLLQPLGKVRAKK